MTDTHSLALLDYIPSPIALIENSNIIHANSGFKELFYDISFLHHSFTEFVLPKQNKKILHYFEKILKNNSEEKIQPAISCTLILHNEEIEVEIQAKKIKLQEKNILICSFLNITALQKSHTAFSHILNAMPEAIFTFNPNHNRILSVTSGCEGIYGIPVDQFTSNVFHPIDLVIPEDMEKAQNFYANLLKNEFDEIEYRIVHTNGDTVWIHDEAEVIYKENGLGEVLLVYHFIRNITEKKIKDEHIQLNEERYRRIFERSTNPIFLVTAEGNFLDLNDAAISLFEFKDKTEAFQTNIQNLFYNQNQMQNILSILTEKGSITDKPMTMRSKNGNKINIIFTAGFRRKDKISKPKRFQVILHDPRAVIKQTELETYRRTLGGISDRINNIAQAQMMQQGLIRDCLFDLQLQSEKEQKIQSAIQQALLANEKTSKDLANLGHMVRQLRQLYHNPKPPKPVSDGAGGILFDLTS